MLVGTTREDLIRELKLAPLPVEGGMFRQTYKDAHSTAIYFLVEPGDFSALHRQTYPEVFHFYAGAPARMLLLKPDGSVEEPVLGIDLANGEKPQVVVHPGIWQGTETLGEWTLLGTTMAPGYTEECFELGSSRDLVNQYPVARERIERLTRNGASESPETSDGAHAESAALRSEEPPRNCDETEIGQAIKRNDVWFSHIVRAQYAHLWAPAEDVPCWRRLSADARSSFGKAHGGIGEALFLPDAPGGVMMTGDGKLFAELWLNRLPFDDITETRAFVFDLEVLRERVDLYLPADAAALQRKRRDASADDAEASDVHSGNIERDVCMRKLLLVYRGLLGTLDNEAKRKEAGRGLSAPFRRELAELRRELAGAEKTFLDVLRPRAEHRYMVGSLLGAAVAAVLVVALAVLLHLFDAGGRWAVVALAGAGGAVASVWFRFQAKELQVDVDAGRSDLGISGALRPLIGILSALGIYVFVEAGIIPLDLPERSTTRDFFLAGIAFLAGFSERLAGDAFGRGAASFSTVSRAGN